MEIVTLRSRSIIIKMMANLRWRVLTKINKDNVVCGDLNLFGCFVFNSDILMNDDFKVCLAKLGIIEIEKYW